MFDVSNGLVVAVLLALGLPLGACSPTGAPTGGDAAADGGAVPSDGGHVSDAAAMDCAADTGGPETWEAFFIISNPHSTPLFLRSTCDIEAELVSCSDRYAAPLPTGWFCGLRCDDQVNECPPCATPEGGVDPCAPEPLEVGPDVATSWEGQLFTKSVRNDGCQCWTQGRVSPGKYRFLLPVYTSKEAAVAGDVAWKAMVDFEMPRGGQFYVKLVPPSK
jgi:hypothetical protein